MQPFFTQLIDLTLMQLTNWRWSWRASVINGIFAPSFMLIAASLFNSGRDPESLGYILTGNLVISLLFSTMGQVSSHFAFMRAVGRLDFFATLPVYRSTLILATVLAFLALSLPSTLAMLVIGTLVLQVPLHISPLIIIVVPLTAISLSALGALIGLIGRTPEEVSSVNMLLTFALGALGPVLFPPARLPEIVTTISLLSPATYAASAFRQVVLGWPDRLPLLLDIGVLLAVSVITLWLVGQRLDWRRA